MLFARKITGPLSSLLKQFDAAVEKHKEADLRSFAVFLTDDSEALETQLKELAEKEKISDNVPLALMEDMAGPPDFRVHQDAEVTVLLYTKTRVVKNYAYRAGDLKEKDVKRIVASIPQILPDKEELDKQAKAREELRKKLKAIKDRKKEE